MSFPFQGEGIPRLKMVPLGMAELGGKFVLSLYMVALPLKPD